jgi:hypothetical protein
MVLFDVIEESDVVIGSPSYLDYIDLQAYIKGQLLEDLDLVIQSNLGLTDFNQHDDYVNIDTHIGEIAWEYAIAILNSHVLKNPFSLNFGFELNSMEPHLSNLTKKVVHFAPTIQGITSEQSNKINELIGMNYGVQRTHLTLKKGKDGAKQGIKAEKIANDYYVLNGLRTATNVLFQEGEWLISQRFSEGKLLASEFMGDYGPNGHDYGYVLGKEHPDVEQFVTNAVMHGQAMIVGKLSALPVPGLDKEEINWEKKFTDKLCFIAEEYGELNVPEKIEEISHFLCKGFDQDSFLMDQVPTNATISYEDIGSKLTKHGIEFGISTDNTQLTPLWLGILIYDSLRKEDTTTLNTIQWAIATSLDPFDFQKFSEANCSGGNIADFATSTQYGIVEGGINPVQNIHGTIELYRAFALSRGINPLNTEEEINFIASIDKYFHSTERGSGRVTVLSDYGIDVQISDFGVSGHKRILYEAFRKIGGLIKYRKMGRPDAYEDLQKMIKISNIAFGNLSAMWHEDLVNPNEMKQLGEFIESLSSLENVEYKSYDKSKRSFNWIMSAARSIGALKLRGLDAIDPTIMPYLSILSRYEGVDGVQLHKMVNHMVLQNGYARIENLWGSYLDQKPNGTFREYAEGKIIPEEQQMSHLLVDTAYLVDSEVIFTEEELIGQYVSQLSSLDSNQDFVRSEFYHGSFEPRTFGEVGLEFVYETITNIGYLIGNKVAKSDRAELIKALS